MSTINIFGKSDIYLETIIKTEKREKKSSSSLGNFTEQEVDLAKTPLFFPKGFEKIFLTIYITLFPYFAGTLFLFFYVSEGKKEAFFLLYKQTSFILNWCIGYEILAGVALLFILKQAIGFFVKPKENRLKPFIRPTK
jgi:hypothetical protein